MQPTEVMVGFGWAGAGNTSRKINGLNFQCFCGMRTGAGLWAKGVLGPVWCGPWRVVGVSLTSIRAVSGPPPSPWIEWGSYRGFLRSPHLSQ